MYDYAVIGGGIVGLATAAELLRLHPGKRLLLVEKEVRWAAHQSGRNSNVIHSGLYYKPGTLKAKMAVAGNRSMVEFCRAHDIPHDVCGKLVVATSEAEVPLLDALEKRGRENGLEVKRTDREGARAIEPHVRAVSALHIPSTGITDYRAVCEKLALIARERGAELLTGVELLAIEDRADSVILRTTAGEKEARFVIACAGLQSDRVARSEGLEPGARIVPFRGEYYELREEKRELVRGLIYPVPNPDFPFLGVHLTRMIDGSVHAGPNAVLALKREGYNRTSFSLRDVAATFAYPGFWRMASRNLREGTKEMARSWSTTRFVHSLQQLVPEITVDDVVPAAAGVRAQALRRNGDLVDDFLFVHGRRSLHVCNAPSPAATASLEIARAIVSEVAARKS